ncbi:hypothetical protein CTH_10045 (plasmid) [Carboxydocella thermautotrophica]|nr:hypothetical protein CTH_10045 [Carboxydocella thermautotrophica]
MQVVTEVKRFKKSNSVDIVIQEGINRKNELILDLRYYVTTESFEGFRKNGIRMEGPLGLEVIEFLYNTYILGKKGESK